MEDFTCHLGFLLLMKNQNLTILASFLRGTCHLELSSGFLLMEERGSANILCLFANPGPMVYYGNCQYLIFKCLNRIDTVELFHENIFSFKSLSS